MTEFSDLPLTRWRELAHARNREIDHEPRTIEVTDDDMVLLLAVLDRLVGN